MPSKRVNEEEEPRLPSPHKSFQLDPDAPWGGFINVKLDDTQKAAFEKWWEANPDYSAQILSELLPAGIKVTLAYDGDNDSWLCSFTGRLVRESNERFVTTTRAGSLVEVIALACWKHVYVVRGIYKKYSNNNKPLWG